MKKSDEKAEISAHLSGHIENLQYLLEQVSSLEARITKMVVKLHKFNMSLDGSRTETRNSSNIIPFPGLACQNKDEPPVLTPYLAEPGSLLPQGIPDYRPALQRNGLILLAWDKRINGLGEQYSAYWVTSTGIPRFYASKPLGPTDFPSATPHHKSYAAEDGIEFYGQDAPSYIVHVAPELMMSNPNHDDLRSTHIAMLKSQGSSVDFDYKYLLKNDKKRDLPSKRSNGKSHHQTGA